MSAKHLLQKLVGIKPPLVFQTNVALVAERLCTGLYVMSAADISTNPSIAEAVLRDAFKICKICNTLLLIDEADVFLTMRTAAALEQNSMVSGN